MKASVKCSASALGIVVLGVACGQPDLSEPSAKSGETIQGEPIESVAIQGEPIEAPLVAEETVTEEATAVAVAEESGTVEPVPEVGTNEAGGVAETVAESVASSVEQGTLTELAANAAADAELEVLAAPVAEDATERSQEPVVHENGALDVSFDRLASFEYEMPEDLTEEVDGEAEGGSDLIPKEIRELNDQSIALKGFMLPLKVEEGLVTEMLIMRDQSMCCYGTVPKINEWVSVRMEGKGVKPVMDQAVTMFGTLKVGEIRENGYLVGIYEMDGDRMDGPTDL